MRMSGTEKKFVNGVHHSNRVAEHAERLVRITNPQPGQRLLDVGCGNGAAPIHLANSFGLDVTGIDVDPEQIRAATAAGVGLPATRFLVADATRLPFPNDEFDIVITSKTTHHISDWPRALTEMTRVLKPGGRLVYRDFVAPLGSRLPTRRALNLFASEHQLQTVRRTHVPLIYTAVLRTPPPSEREPAGHVV